MHGEIFNRVVFFDGMIQAPPDPRRIPVVMAISDTLSGVDSWVWRLAKALEGHPRFDLKLLGCNSNPRENPRFDAWANWVPSVDRFLASLGDGPIVLIPNYLWQIVDVAIRRVEAGQDLRIIGFCHSDSESEYYRPLEHFEPLIARFVGVSHVCAETLRSRLDEARRDDVFEVPYGIELGPEPTAKLRAKADPLRLVYAGRIAEVQKRCFDFEPLCAALRERSVSFELDLVGDGDDRAELERRLAPYGDRVRFLGQVDAHAMPAIFDAHDVFVQISEFEGTSNSLLEAMARGLVPAITRTASGVDGVVEGGTSAIVVETGAMQRLAEELASLAKDPARVQRMRHAAWRAAHAFAMDTHVERLTAIFEDAVRGENTRRWPSGRPRRPAAPIHGGLIGLPRRKVKLRQFVRRLLGRS